MKTQISRHSHQPGKRYSGVYQQQGRMITDADWNELTEIVKTRLDDALADVVASGVPRDRRIEIKKRDNDLRIVPGHLYAEGVKAEVVPAADVELEAQEQQTGKMTFDYTEQADFPDPPKLAKDGKYVVYADVWERPVVSLEDPALRDPALHGADTTTRTQTMAQVKCADKLPADNAAIGNAELSLSLLAEREEQDSDDPCAKEIPVEQRTGNYLFRVEVHDIGEKDEKGDLTLTLKWSSENGAEQHQVLKDSDLQALPTEFTTGDWVYELYDETCEKHLGVHLPLTQFKPTRGKLSSGFPTETEGLDHIRRWDGFCVLTAGSDGRWSLDHGKDRGDDLSSSSTQEHGLVTVSGDLKINLEALVLTLTLEGKTFVAGDYWLAPVREADHSSGDKVLDREPPLGIVHHYLELATVDAEGNLDGDGFRRLSFPPLSDLGAQHVSYEASAKCSDLRGTKTVKDALDTLCVRPSGPGPGPGRGCRITVGPGGEIERLERATIEELSKSYGGNLCLCLLPGDHQLPQDLSVDSDLATHLGIEGCGAASRLILSGKNLAFKKVTTVRLRDLSIQALTGGQLIFDGCDEVRLESLSVTGRSDKGGLVEIRRTKQLHMATSSVQLTGLDHMKIIAEILKGSPAGVLFRIQDLDEGKFKEKVPSTAAAWHQKFHGKPAAEDFLDKARRRLHDSWHKQDSWLSSAQKKNIEDLIAPLGTPVVRSDHAEKMLWAIWLEAQEVKPPGTAVTLAACEGVTVLDSGLFGLVSLYGQPQSKQLTVEELGAIPENLGFAASGRLCLSRNVISQLVVGEEMVKEQLRKLKKSGNQTIDGAYRAAFLTDNVFLSGVLQLVAMDVKMSSNDFQKVRPDDLAFVVAKTAIYVGNQDTEPDHVLYDVASRSLTESNLMTIAKP
ncbi:MAG: hypothetical protein GY856_18430 [bacterium]|nr:hypothetical protein [bacterium]